MGDQNEHHEHHHHPHDLDIWIDKQEVDAPKKVMDGLELRNLHKPPIGPDRDLWLEVHGKGDDKKIGDHEEVHLHKGMRFYSTERKINPGAVAR